MFDFLDNFKMSLNDHNAATVGRNTIVAARRATDGRGIVV
jgi:hypothetical protein